MFFDALVQPSAVDVEDAGDHVLLHYEMSLIIPVNQQQAARVPVGRVRMPLDKESALAHGKKLVELAEALPDPPKQSDLVVPSNVNVDKVAEELRKFKS